MFIQISEKDYVNLNLVARVIHDISEGSGESFLFYGSNKELLAQSDWGSQFGTTIVAGLQKYGLVVHH